MISIPERPTGEKKRVGLYLLEDIHDALKEVSDNTGVPMSEIVGLVMEEWLREEGYLEDDDTNSDPDELREGNQE